MVISASFPVFALLQSFNFCCFVIALKQYTALNTAASILLPRTRYDEPQMLKDIERRLGQTIAHLPSDMKLTGGLETLVFGAHKDASSAPANSDHFRRLRPVMEELVHLETSAQVT